MSGTVALPAPARVALQAYATAFPQTPDVAGSLGAAWAPGRVNLIGEHTDYNAGYVLPLAVDRVVAFAGRARRDQIVRLWSQHFQAWAEFSLQGLPAAFEQTRETLPHWARYILGVATELRRAGIALTGFEAVLQGDVPVGGGMSSSAALEVASVQAFRLFAHSALTPTATNAPLTPMQIAQLCQRAEWAASGVRCGLLDQAASCLGQPGQAVLLDCRSLDYRYLPFEASGVSLVVIDTGVRRALAASAYNERRQQCEEAARLIASAEPGREIVTLRDISWAEFEHHKAALPEMLRRRAGYVIAENARVLEAVARLQRNDLPGVGELLWQTHAGLRDEYEVSCVELDTLVELARSVPGVLGARMMGGGFGGCTVNLVRDEAIEALKHLVEQQYPARTGRQAKLDICRAAGGPGLLSNVG